MIIGIDEVGRGCWAGPLVAAAVGLPQEHAIIGLDDSKKLTTKKRLQLVQEIQQATNVIGIGWVWPREINATGLTKSVQLAMHRAIKDLPFHGHHIIIDGNINYLENILYKDTPCCKECPCMVEAIVGADGIIPEVSAASIVAKVARDTYMIKIAEKYTAYGFEKHVGYGTKLHIDALARHGVTPIHRVNYKPVKKWLVNGE